MIGKKNIVFGFLFLVVTAALGPYMAVEYVPSVDEARAQKQTSVGRLQTLKADDFEEDLDPLPPEAIAKANTDGILALNTLINAEQPIAMIKGGPHAHGNLESLLNIVVGILLGLLAISTKFKQVISWVFILGTVLHSGSLYLIALFQLSWAVTVLNTGVGPVLILLGLLMAGVATIMGYKGQWVQD